MNLKPMVLTFTLTIGIFPAAQAEIFPAPQAVDAKPNVVFILTDNLGYGEIGAYGGGITRGAPTPRIDSLAQEGIRLLNMNMEAQCTPSRSSLMTGRWAIRSGTYAVSFNHNQLDGLTQWEITIAEALSNVGYTTALYGKWHLGNQNGRYPNDQGFDEWFGIPRTTDETLWQKIPGYDPALVPPEPILYGRKGQGVEKVADYTYDNRGYIDNELTERTVKFINDQSRIGRPFFVLVALTQPHLPTIPNPIFVRDHDTRHGSWANMLAEMDVNVGRILDSIDQANVRENTIVVFTSDNGAEYTKPWDGWSGPWRGQYFTALEGGIRVPFMMRWPGKVPAGQISNEIVHGVDMFATLAHFTGAKIPTDRPIDSVDQADFFLGKTEKSNRIGFPVFVADRLQAVKWNNWKMHFYRQDTMVDPPVENPVPVMYDLFADPREEKPEMSWAIGPIYEVVAEFEDSVKKYPLIPIGTPDPYQPPVQSRLIKSSSSDQNSRAAYIKRLMDTGELGKN